jgi:hypothetical protein
MATNLTVEYRHIAILPFLVNGDPKQASQSKIVRHRLVSTRAKKKRYANIRAGLGGVARLVENRKAGVSSWL